LDGAIGGYITEDKFITGELEFLGMVVNDQYEVCYSFSWLLLKMGKGKQTLAIFMSYLGQKIIIDKYSIFLKGTKHVLMDDIFSLCLELIQ